MGTRLWRAGFLWPFNPQTYALHFRKITHPFPSFSLFTFLNYHYSYFRLSGIVLIKARFFFPSIFYLFVFGSIFWGEMSSRVDCILLLYFSFLFFFGSNHSFLKYPIFSWLQYLLSVWGFLQKFFSLHSLFKSWGGQPVGSVVTA